MAACKCLAFEHRLLCRTILGTSPSPDPLFLSMTFWAEVASNGLDGEHAVSLGSASKEVASSATSPVGVESTHVHCIRGSVL